MSPTASPSGTRSGLTITAQFFSATDKPPYKRNDGQEVRPCLLILVGPAGEQYRIEFDSRQELEAAIGVPELGGSVTVPVYANGAWDPETRRRGQVFYRAAV